MINGKCCIRNPKNDMFLQMLHTKIDCRLLCDFNKVPIFVPPLLKLGKANLVIMSNKITKETKSTQTFPFRSSLPCR